MMTIETQSVFGSLPQQAADVASRAGSGDRFDAMLRKAQSGGDTESIRESAEKLVSSAFLLPLLEQMRASAKQNELFYGGTGEDLFGQQLDTMVADRIVQSSRFPIVDAVAQQFARAGGLGDKVNTHG